MPVHPLRSSDTQVPFAAVHAAVCVVVLLDGGGVESVTHAARRSIAADVNTAKGRANMSRAEQDAFQALDARRSAKLRWRRLVARDIRVVVAKSDAVAANVRGRSQREAPAPLEPWSSVGQLRSTGCHARRPACAVRPGFGITARRSKSTRSPLRR